MSITAAQIIARTQAEGNESAQFALMDNPADLIAVENAVAAGARWSRFGENFFLSMPGSVDTLVIVFPGSDTADFGDGINAFRTL